MPPVHSTQRIPFSKYETRELDNFRKLHWVLFEVGSACVRKVFDTEIQPDQLKKTLGTLANKQKIYPATTMEQRLFLYPAQGEPTSQSLDITLLICLLKHLVEELFISDTLPDKKDVSVGADLSRLKYYRNMFSHLSSYKINEQKFEELYKDISQVIERLGCPEWKEDCEKVRMRILETCNEEEKSLLLQLFIILHSKGHNVLNKISETFWSYSTIEQLCLILSLLEFHFWIYPTIKTIWDEFQDSYYMNSDIKFFERTECHLQSDTQDPPYGECFPKLSSATGTMPIEGSHTIEVDGKNYQSVIETDENITETDENTTETGVAKNIIKIRCRCHLEKAGICFLVLLSQLNTKRYRHDHNKTNENSDDIYQYHILGNNEIMTYIAQDEEKIYTEKMQTVFETHMGSNIFFQPRSVDLIPAVYAYTPLSYNTSTGYDLCNTVCGNRNLLN